MNRRMVTFSKILRLITAEPFRPFRIRTEGGRTFDIIYPDTVAVGVSRVTISRFYDDREDENPHDFEFLLSSIEEIEPISAGSAAPSQDS